MSSFSAQKSAGPSNTKPNNGKLTNNAVDTAEETAEETSVFDLRTYDRHWVNENTLQYPAGWEKVPDPSNPGKYIRWKKMLSSIPVILRDMGPPDVSFSKALPPLSLLKLAHVFCVSSKERRTFFLVLLLGRASLRGFNCRDAPLYPPFTRSQRRLAHPFLPIRFSQCVIRDQFLTPK